MKTLSSLSLVAFAAAIALLPVSLELSVGIAVLCGISALLLGDYSREHSAVALRA